MSVELSHPTTIVPQQLELDLWQILAVAQTESATVSFDEVVTCAMIQAAVLGNAHCEEIER